MRLRYAVLFCCVVIVLCCKPAWADRVYYSSDGTVNAANDGQASGKAARQTQKTMTLKEKLDQEAAAAAAKGYKVGQTVKVENGITYKLAIDPATKAYTFKLYRMVKKEKTVKKKTKIKQSNVVKHSRTQETDAERIAREKRLALEEAQKQKDDGKQAAKQVEADKKEAERQRLKKLYAGNSGGDRRLKPWDVLVAAEHRYFEWRTVLNKRSVTTEAGTTSVSEGVGVDGLFYTKTHADLMKLRLMVTHSLELFLEAGMNYERVSDVTDMEALYGGGLRYVLAETGFWTDAGAYLDVYAEYLTGSISGPYKDVEGNNFDKTLDFTEIESGLQGGIRFYRLTLNAGLSYGLYSEDVVRKQDLALPAISIYKDEMEQQDNLDISIGFEYRLKPQWNICGSWHSQFKDGGLIGVEYRF